MAQQRFKNLPVKTFTATSAPDMDKQIEEFRKDNIIFMTQTHVLPEDKSPTGFRFFYVVFYVDKKSYKSD